MEALEKNQARDDYYDLYEILKSDDAIASAIQCYTSCTLRHSIILKQLECQNFDKIKNYLEFVYNNAPINELKEIVIYTKINNKRIANAKKNKKAI